MFPVHLVSATVFLLLTIFSWSLLIFLPASNLCCVSVVDLIYWKEMERTGLVLTGLVVGLLSLFQLSIITVVSTVSLAVMCFTISVRIYYQVLYILSWGDGVHPFK